MADLARLPGVYQQLKLVGGLRWKLLRNGMQRKSNRWDLIGMFFAALGSGMLVLGLCAGFFAGSYYCLAKGRPGWMSLLFWALFLWWQVVPIFVAGFSATFEFKKLLRFPLSLRAFYLLGLGYGFADFAAVSAIVWIVSMLAGAATARIGLLPWMLAVSVLFVFLNVTLERLLGSWLEKLLANRRSRELFVGLFVLGCVSINFVSLFFQHYGNRARPRVEQLLPALWWAPGSLAGRAIAAAASGEAGHALLGIAGLAVWLGALSALLWKRFEAQYRGEELSESVAPGRRGKLPGGPRTDRARGGDPRGLALPFVSQQVSGIMAKEFHYLVRNGFSFLTFFIPPLMVVFFSFQFAGRNSPLKNHALSPDLFFPAMMAYLILILLAPAYNSFAYEGRGIQTYFMTPVRFRDVLLAKNLFLVTLVTIELGTSLAIMIWRVGWPSTPRFFATVGIATFAVTGQLTLANWSSLSFPKKMEIGKMKGQRNSGVAVWTAFGVQILLGGIGATVLVAGRWLDNPWLPAEVFLVLTVAGLAGYVSSMESLDRLAERKKERLIETLCK